jgi:hypothetical protein
MSNNNSRDYNGSRLLQYAYYVSHAKLKQPFISKYQQKAAIQWDIYKKKILWAIKYVPSVWPITLLSRNIPFPPPLLPFDRGVFNFKYTSLITTYTAFTFWIIVYHQNFLLSLVFGSLCIFNVFLYIIALLVSCVSYLCHVCQCQDSAPCIGSDARYLPLDTFMFGRICASCPSPSFSLLFSYFYLWGCSYTRLSKYLAPLIIRILVRSHSNRSAIEDSCFSFKQIV